MWKCTLLNCNPTPHSLPKPPALQPRMLCGHRRLFLRLAMQGLGPKRFGESGTRGSRDAKRAAERALHGISGGGGGEREEKYGGGGGQRRRQKKICNGKEAFRRGYGEVASVENVGRRDGDGFVSQQPQQQQQQQQPRSRTSASTLSQVTEDLFEKLGIHPATKKAMAKVFGYEKMTKVQSATIPVGLTGVDLLAKAKTGTGKTIAFLIPAIERIVQEGGGDGSNVSVLVISPTRELAQQIAEEGKGLVTYHQDIGLDCVVGGTNMRGDLQRFSKRVPDILVATPGRLLDHLENQGLRRNLLGMRILILDECDRLLDMGFRNEIEKICRLLPKERQTVLFSATLPDDVELMCRTTLNASYKLIDCVGEEENTHEHVSQTCIISPMDQQVGDLLGVIKAGISEPGYKIIAFFTTARLTQFYAELFNNLNIKVLEIHSRKTQRHRERISEQFRNGSELIMFTSDVSARGMDYPDVSQVVQVGMPSNREQYIHRLGRTARAGKGGHGVLMLCDFEQNFLRELKEIPIEKVSSPSENTDNSVEISRAVSRLSDVTIGCAYQAWLGFYNSNMKTLRWDKEHLVRVANEFAAQVCQQTEPPALNAMTVGKMGLKGVAGLNVDRGNSVGRSGGTRGGRGGQGGPRNGSGGGSRQFGDRNGTEGSGDMSEGWGRGNGGGRGMRGGGRGGPGGPPGRGRGGSSRGRRPQRREQY